MTTEMNVSRTTAASIDLADRYRSKIGPVHSGQLAVQACIALGRKKKIGLGPRSHLALEVLAHGKFLRGTPFDPFGYAKVRRIERTLLSHYEATITDLASNLTTENYALAVQFARAPELVRGYEDVKLRNVATYVRKIRELGIDGPAIEGLSEAAAWTPLSTQVGSSVFVTATAHARSANAK